MKIAIIGDVIQDDYIIGHSTRLSPEAPVPVIKDTQTKSLPGGAANVLANLKALTPDVILCSSTATIPVKTRIISNGQCICRIDDEKPNIKWITTDEYIFADLVVISDYAKGAIDNIQLAPILKKLIVDPKRHLSYFVGAWCVKPNQKEFAETAGKWSGLNELETKMREIKKLYRIDNLIVTLGQDGVALVDEDEKFFHVEAEACQVFDVTGAGDTFTAVLAFAISRGETMISAVRCANHTASIAVSKHGTYVISKEDVILNDVVFTNGCFDILHPGHIEYLKKSKELGRRLIVGLNSDDSVKRLKGNGRPINSLSFRKAMLEALPFVDEVRVFEEDTPINLIREIMPDVITKGGDYVEQNVVGYQIVKHVIIIPMSEGYSSTSIIEKIRG